MFTHDAQDYDALSNFGRDSDGATLANFAVIFIAILSPTV